MKKLIKLLFPTKERTLRAPNSHINWEIQDHADLLNFVCPEPERQKARRLAAIMALANVGSEAVSVIPSLLNTHFNGISTEERDQALVAIETIDPNWLFGEHQREILDFLLKQLPREGRKSKKAEELLVRMAVPAIAPLKNIVQNSLNPPFSKAAALRALGKIKPQDQDDLKSIIETLIHSEPSILELDACAEALGLFETWDDEILSHLVELNSHRDSSIRQKALSALANARGGNLDIVIAAVVPQLMEEDQTLRQLAIKVLSLNHNSSKLKEVLALIIEKNGKPEFEDVRAVLNNLFFWTQSKDNELKPFKVSSDQGLKNVTWYVFDVQKSTQKPVLLLESALMISNKISFFDPKLYESITAVFGAHNVDSIKLNCVKILAHLPQRTSESIPFLLRHVLDESAVIREQIIHALNTLDNQWFARPESTILIQKLIHGIDGFNSKENAILFFVALGPGIVPQLIAHLEQSNNRFAQEAIVKALQSFDSSADIKANLATLQKIQAKITHMHIVEELKKIVTSSRLK